jgi:glycosyltransferase involved in cell wall biosynthesis
MGKMKYNGNDISVVIRTKNEERWIGHSIQSILDNIKKPEIIIIDNNSSDNTINIINHFIQDPLLNKEKKSTTYTDIKIHKISNYSPGKALNLGVKLANRKYILVISAHCELKKINLTKHLKDLEKFVGIFGNQNPKWNGKKITKRYLWSHFDDQNEIINMFSKLENRYFFHNAASLFTKKTLVKYPFNEILAGKEDRYWGNNLIKKKKSFLYDPSFEVVHHYTENGNTWKGLG